MRIERIDDNLEICEQYLSSASEYGKEIENLLIQSLRGISYWISLRRHCCRMNRTVPNASEPRFFFLEQPF